nr:MAG TPA: hypothetical protein [Caudoviricetes sp.]
MKEYFFFKKKELMKLVKKIFEKNQFYFRKNF